MKQIDEATKLTAARNAEHYQFHHDALDAITEEFAEAQKISALRATYKELFDKEDTAFVQSRALAGTVDVEEKDAVRDELTRYVCSIVDAKQRSLAAAINSLYTVNAVITQDESTETALAEVIDTVNGLILQLSQTVETREAKAETANEKKKTTTE